MVLAGVGHANLEVLRRLSRPGRAAGLPGAGVELTVISPEPWHCYSGMVPGYLRGTYRLEEIAVELEPLVRRAGGRLQLGWVAGLDPRRSVVKVAEPTKAAAAAAMGGAAPSSVPEAGREPSAGEVPYDFVALAVGSDAAGAAAAVASAGGTVLSCKPIGRVVQLRRRLDALAGRQDPPATVAVVGGGAAGVEIALAIAGRFLEPPPSPHRVVLVEAGPEILANSSPRLRRRTHQVLERHGVEVRTSCKVLEVEPAEALTTRAAVSLPDAAGAGAAGGAILVLSTGKELSCTLAVWATAAVGWPLFHEAGLPLDGRGFLLIDDSLRSVVDPRVFAAGDCGTLATFPGTAKAGVYAVREGPVLFRSLRAALTGEPPPRYRPQRGFLMILNTGDGRALLSYKGFVSYSCWAFRLKDRIDRRFLARYRRNR